MNDTIQAAFRRNTPEWQKHIQDTFLETKGRKIKSKNLKFFEKNSNSCKTKKKNRNFVSFLLTAFLIPVKKDKLDFR